MGWRDFTPDDQPLVSDPGDIIDAVAFIACLLLVAGVVAFALLTRV